MNKLTRLLISGLALWSASVAANKHSGTELSIERIFESPSLQGAAQKELQVSPDGKRVTFLQGKKDNYERLDLWGTSSKAVKHSIRGKNTCIHLYKTITNFFDKHFGMD